MKRMLIIGAGGYGRMAAEVAEACGYTVSFLDDRPGGGVIGALDQLEELAGRFAACFVAIGRVELRRSLNSRLEAAGVTPAVLIHPSAFVSPSAGIGPGTMVAPHAVVNAHAAIGAGCILAVGALVDHHARIGEYVYLNAGAICKSGAQVESGRVLDAGAVARGYDD